MTVEELKTIFANKLNLLMQKTDHNQEDIAKICGVSQQTVSDWLNAKKYPRMDKVGIIIEHFQIPISALVDDGKTEPLIVSEELRKMVETFNSLSREEQQFVLKFVSFLSEQSETH